MSVPQSNFGPGQQSHAPGWRWDSGGRAGTGIMRKPYEMAAGPDTVYYFNGQRKPTSSVQLGGQPHVGNYVDPCRY